MAGVNRVQLIGNLGADPELRNAGGTAVADLRLATTRKWTDKSGAAKEETQWHRVVVWGRQAESCAKYLSKGRQVYVEGRLQTREWDDKDGKKRWTTEVVANDVQFLGGRGGDAPAQEVGRSAAAPEDGPDCGDDDIPF